METMLWYYPFPPRFPHRLNAWRKGPWPPVLTQGAGHAALFSDRRTQEVEFPMLHYLFLSPVHAVRKWVHRSYDPGELAGGWHRSRAELKAGISAYLRLHGARSTLGCLNPSSSGRMGLWRTEMMRAEQRRFCAVAGDALAELGYDG